MVAHAHPLQIPWAMGDALIGTIVEERYRIEGLLGAGAMGRVYRARHTKIGREVAIKVLRADLVRERQIVARFAREAQVAARLLHPNLVGVLDVGTTPTGEQLMVMELAPGVPLGSLVGAPMPRTRVVTLVTQLLHGLSHAHAAGLVHRDLKPENVLVERGEDDEHARIVDFGIAVLRDGSADAGRRLTDAGLVVGTPMYMAPEQASGKPVDHRADLFALGVIVYELLCGVTPFQGTGAEIAFANVTKDPPLMAERVPGVTVDPLLEAFARRLMARRPEDRFASAHDALAMLELIDRDRLAAARTLFTITPAEPPAAVLRLPRESDALSTLPMAEPEWTEVIVRTPPRRHRAVIAGAVAALAVLVGWAWLRNPSPRREAPAVSIAPLMPAPLMPAPTMPAPTMIELAEPPLPRPMPPMTPPPPAARAPSTMGAGSPTHPVRGHAHAQPVIGARVQVAAPARDANAEARDTTAEARDTTAEVPAPARDASPDVLAARYHAIGNALHARGTDELWQRYRLIHLGDAMATPATREQALATLDAIERALPSRS